MSLIGEDVDLLARLVGVGAKRHEVVATNLANINTPHYRARELRFEAEFQSALRSGGARAALEVKPETMESETAEVKSDGNSVHLERELGLMQKNQLLYNVYVTLMRSKIAHLRRAIGGGR